MPGASSTPAADCVLTHEIFLLDATMQKRVSPAESMFVTNRIVDGLLQRLHMTQLAPLQYCPATDARFPGFSFIQPITTSHISGHYFDDPGDPHIHMDIYSCIGFDWQIIIPFLHRHLHLGTWSANYIIRSRTGERQYYEMNGEGYECLRANTIQRMAEPVLA